MQDQTGLILIEHHSRLQRMMLSVMLLCFMSIISLVDYYSGRYISVFAFYIVPVILATWKIGGKTGIVFAVLAGLSGFIIELILKPNTGLPLLLTNALTRMGALCFLAYSAWKIKILTKRLNSISEEDFLTGALNRRGFFLQGQIELERMTRAHQPVSLVYIDIDHFKKINDSIGHDAGDKVLQQVAAIIKSNTRKIDLLARIGGDEFVLILPSTSSPGALQIGEKLLAAIQNKRFLNNLFIGVSIGIASFMTPPDSISHALTCADKLMYKVKKANKNGILQGEF